jgi:hypothetical protein
MSPVVDLHCMKDFLIGIFIFLLIPNLYVDSVVFVAFKIQQDYIVNNLCVQKDEVVNTCNGSCVLSNQLKEAEANQENSEYPANSKTRITLDYIAFESSSSINTFQMVKKRISVYDELAIHQTILGEVFHPPQF